MNWTRIVRHSNIGCQRWIAALCLLALSGCFTFEHTVGAGPIRGTTVEDSRWFALFGLADMSEQIDSQELVGNNADYRVTTKFTTKDVLISAVPSILGFYRQSVIIEK